MASDIRQYLNSNFVHLSNKFRKKKVIQVYVEGEIDKVFWLSFLTPFEQLYNVEFHACVIRDRQKILNGKTSILSHKKETDIGKNLWICIDSDYDELVKDFSAYTNLIRKNKYIITTWWYSIENLKCQPELLADDILKASLADYCSINIEEILSEISNCYKEMFLLLLEMKEQKDKRFKIEDFIQCLTFIEFDENGFNEADVKRKIAEWKNFNKILFNQYGCRFHFWENRLNSLGYKVEDYYHMYCGHGLFDKIAVPLVCYYARKYRTEMLSKIIGGADSASRKKDLVEEYYNNTFTTRDRASLKHRVVQLITDNSPCGNSTASAKIKEQIKNALESRNCPLKQQVIISE